jgi:hypothetical protein
MGVDVIDLIVNHPTVELRRTDEKPVAGSSYRQHNPMR